MTISLALGLGLTYFATPVVLYLAVLRFCGGPGDWRILSVCFGVAPALISRLVTWLLYAYPGGEDRTYVIAVIAVISLLAVYGRSRIAALRELAETFAWSCDRSVQAAIIVAVAVAVAATVTSLIPTFGVVLERSYDIAKVQWNSDAEGWAGVMPLFAAATLLGLIISAAWVLLAPGGRKKAARPVLSVTSGVLGGMVISAVVIIAILQLGRPIYESDALNYFKIATILYESKSLSSYPLVFPQSDGMYDPSAHPLGYLGTLIWSFMLAGAAVPGTAKPSVLMATAATLMGLAVALKPRGPIALTSAMLILITTPGYVFQVLATGIDGQRLALLLFTVIALAIVLQHQGWRSWVVAGIVSGLALNSHSQMALLVPTAIVATIAVSGALVRDRLASIIIIGSVAFFVGGERYVLNFIQFGTPLYNDAALFELLPELDYHGWRFGLAPRQDLWGRLSSGGLMGFTYWYFFGLSWWLGLLAFVVANRELFACPILKAISAVVILNFVLLVVFFAFTPAGELLIANYRYVLSLQPMVAALGGCFIGSLYEFRAARS
jgi:hypothetical protein